MLFSTIHLQISLSLLTDLLLMLENILTATDASLAKKLILYNFSEADDHFLFTHAILNESRRPADDNSSEALLALDVVLQFALDFQLPVKHIFSAYHTNLAMLQRPDHVIAWRLHSQISNIRSLLDMTGNAHIHEIPHSWMAPATLLASYGLVHQSLNLFLFGKDLPYWIMKSFFDFGFVF
ncbi:uncharacterized protein LOC120265741 isoform X2 [Dioscorea cayenensis subsp. rotundata]|uniref:Uncharacterized protein LOC120265741 isoform X2 n=1 Tax=Dioscorea cayennensis subsp. rotundata TaxID=55577 RepID=A0AB40BTP7_DIOCR|nr:uncharacterized protein LOC120265741 isoform X2 [Dioscorea cayenensis subsp. rotundata]